MHAFFHTLDVMSQYWYVSAKLCRKITTSEELTVCFTHTFSFANSNRDVHNALQLIHDVVLKVVLVTYPMDPHAHRHMQSMMECYNVSGGPKDGEGLWNINISKIEGTRDVAAPDVSMDPMNQPLKSRKVNIGIEENPKFASVGDYWDEETMTKIMNLLHEFQDLFSTKFSEMKGILGDLGEMKSH